MRLANPFKRKKGKQYKSEFSVEGYVPREEYEALRQRVDKIESKIGFTEKQEELNFPIDVLERLPPEVKKTIEGVISNYNHDFSDFCFMGMRKALIDAIRIRFRRDGKENMLYGNGDAYKLTRWIDLTKQEKYISRTMAKDLKGKVKVFKRQKKNMDTESCSCLTKLR